VADFPGVLAIGVAIAAPAMCLQAGWALLSFIPRAFAGTAVFFGTALSSRAILLALNHRRRAGMALGRSWRPHAGSPGSYRECESPRAGSLTTISTKGTKNDLHHR
jgi:hypothetical protein